VGEDNGGCVDSSPLGLVIAELVDDPNDPADDGYPDVAVVNCLHPGESVSVFHNTGDWSVPASALTLLGPFTLSDEPYDVKAGDFDGDEDLDLAVTLPWEGKLAILENLGNGQFEMTPTIDLDTSWPTGLVVADLNLDGRLDIAVGSTVGQSPKVEILWKESDASWTHQVIDIPEATGFGTEIVAGSVVKKLQTPALLDLVLATDGGYVATLVNRGNGQFDVVLTYTEVPTYGIALGRFRAGVILPDLVLTDYPAMDRAQVYWNDVYGGWNYKRPYVFDLDPGLYQLGGVATGRLNADTKIDFVLTVAGYVDPGPPYRHPSGIIVFVGYGDGTFVETPYFFHVDDPRNGAKPKFAKIADMDQDGFNDVVTSNNGTHNISVLINALEAIPPGGG